MAEVWLSEFEIFFFSMNWLEADLEIQIIQNNFEESPHAAETYIHQWGLYFEYLKIWFETNYFLSASCYDNFPCFRLVWRFSDTVLGTNLKNVKLSFAFGAEF